MRVQLELRARGLYSGPVDGKLSQETQNSLRAFQIINKLGETGTMDNGTLAKLGIVY
ncbi:MAG: peptidoglycan-binding protein [Afipia sp.]|nr:peptidoglycan-binding protein [Afipia sp.]